MTDDLATALAAITKRLLQLSASDEELRGSLRTLAYAILASTEEPDRQAGTPDADASNVTDSPTTDTDTAPRRDVPSRPTPQPEFTGPPVEELISRLTLGQRSPAPPETDLSRPWRSHPQQVEDADLPLIERRCRLKAEGSRWAARRRRLIAEGADFAIDIAPIDREIIARAKELPDCFLWMNHPSGPSPSDPREFERLASCFDNVAEALSVLRRILADPSLFQNEFEQALDLLAEAQSALRYAIAIMDGPSDTDQFAVFNWLKGTAAEQQIFIQRHMRMNDPADPDNWAALAARIEALESGMQEVAQRSRLRNKLLGKVRHKLTQIADDPEAADEHWRVIAATVDDLITNGLPPSNRELRELLLPAIDDLPDIGELPPGFQQVHDEIDRFIATSSTAEPSSSAPLAPEVYEVARLLNGQSVVLIGGQRRRASQQALRDAFRLQELIWVETRAHESVSSFESYVAQPDVAVVLLAIRWSSHSYGQVREFCEKYGKPLVRLPGGYSTNQVAVQIMQQCSDRLSNDSHN
ncbi:hypothetical protein [Maioricimonas sp. JC845]|uniref:hypothetical protein n=1 Tax=Maioricimonas sp. JC845 TaxID=3232138 RepID=UPI0034593441